MFFKSSIFSRALTVLFFLLPFLTQPAFGHNEDANPELTDLLTIKSRIIEYMIGNESGGDLWRKSVTESDLRTQKILDAPFQPELWEDPEDKQAGYRLNARAETLNRLAESYANPASKFYHQKQAFTRIEEELGNILDHYNPQTPRPGNWYQWLLPLPNHLGSVGLLLENDLPPAQLQQILITLRDQLKDLVLDGSNAAQEARNHLYLALLDKDTDRIQKAIAHALKTLTYSTDFGIREDYSYLFHGRIPYAGGYGANFAQDASQFLYFFNGTRWNVSPEKRDIFANYLLEHVRWFIVDQMQDLHVSGRNYHEYKSIGNWFTALLLMSQVDNARQAEFESTVANILNEGWLPSPHLAGIAAKIDRSTAQEVSGFRFWYAAEMGVYQNKNFHVSFRQFSERVQDYEYLTLKGGDGWNLAYGFTNILRNGLEWYQCGQHHLCDGIDMVHLPGTTARIGAEPTNPNTHIGDIGFSLNRGTSPFSGGTGWQDGGVAGFILEPVFGDFSAQKSLHFFPQGFWALGSNIHSNPQSTFKDLPIHTTVLQWVTPDPLILSGDRSLPAEPLSTQKTFSDVRWFHFDGLGAVFDQPTDLHVRRREGVVTIWIDHGTQVTNGSYAYAVLPDASLKETIAFAKELPVKPVSSNPNIHVVSDPSRSAESIVFFEPGSYRDIETKQPLVLYRKRSESGAVLALQNPLHNRQPIQFNCTMPAEPTFRDPEIEIISAKPGNYQMTLTPILGRIYRAGFGDLGTQVHSSPREDLSVYHQIEVTQESTPTDTVFTFQIPPEAIASGYDLSLRGVKGHLIKKMTEDDVIDRPSPNTIRYRWNRPPPAPPSATDPRLQTSGDFRFYLETPTCITIKYIRLPTFDSDGNIDPSDPGPVDNNKPKRPILD